MEGSVIAARSSDLRAARKASSARLCGPAHRERACPPAFDRRTVADRILIAGDFRYRVDCARCTLALAWRLPYRMRMGDLDRLVPSGIIEQWVFHLRRQRARAADSIWLIDQGFTLHDGHGGTPQHDATARWRAEQETVVEEVTALLALYDGINLGKIDTDASPDDSQP